MQAFCASNVRLAFRTEVATGLRKRMRQHQDAHKISERLKKEQISALYHFTNVENLPGIARLQALCSKQFLESKGNWNQQTVPQPGGNDRSHQIDKEKGNWNFVSLTFTPNTPMAYRAKKARHLCFLEFSTHVALREGVVFTDSNAAHHAQNHGAGITGLDLVNFSMVKSNPLPWDQDWVHQSQAEVMVPDCVGTESIRRVTFVSNASLKEGIRRWGDARRPKFEVDRAPFADHPKSLRNIDFSHISEVFLLDTELTKETAMQTPKTRDKFKKKSGGVITALVEARVLAGTKGRLKWNPGAMEDQVEFETSNEWRWWPSVSTDSLPIGPCSIEIWLNEVRWLTYPFQMVA